MVPSLYNVVAPAAAGGYVLYNTVSQACVVLSEEELAEYRAICDGGDASTEFAQKLDELSFLSEDRQRELDFMRYQFEWSKFDNTVLKLFVCPAIADGTCMAADVAASVLAFAREGLDLQPYKVLEVVWYGKGVLGCLDLIESMSQDLCAFAEDRGVEYRASMITCGDVVDDALAESLSMMGIASVAVMPGECGCDHKVTQTFLGDVVDYATPAKKANVLDTGLCAGLGAGAGLSLDIDSAKTNFAPVGAPAALAPEDHARKFLADFLASGPSKEDFEALLRPLGVYCDAAIERDYAIDAFGNAYNCVEDLGREDHVLFNICEPVSQRRINMKLIAKYGNANPLDLEDCAGCPVFPLCKGGCARTRVEEGVLTCVPYRWIIEELLTEYSRFF